MTRQSSDALAADSYENKTVGQMVKASALDEHGSGHQASVSSTENSNAVGQM